MLHIINRTPNLQPFESERFDNKSTTREDEARLDIKQMDFGSRDLQEHFRRQGLQVGWPIYDSSLAGGNNVYGITSELKTGITSEFISIFWNGV